MARSQIGSTTVRKGGAPGEVAGAQRLAAVLKDRTQTRTDLRIPIPPLARMDIGRGGPRRL